MSAVDSVNSMGIAANLTGSLLATVSGGVDLGILRNNTLASIGAGALVSALDDIDVYALSSKLVQV